MKDSNSKGMILTGLLMALISLAFFSPPVLGQTVNQAERQTEEATQGERETARKEHEQRFLLKSRNLSLLMARFMRGGGKEPVVFDTQLAREAGFDAASIELAEQMVAHTNSLLEAARQSGEIESANVAELKVSLEAFPTVTEYFQEASLLHRNRASEGNTTSKQRATPQEPSAANSLSFSLDPLQLAYQNCGCWWNPLPTRAAPWVTYYSNDPAGTLRSWGYHSTPTTIFGGGYTRAQTHMWWICGFGTFRDHALIVSNNQFREQNYAGWWPRGEPNPEVYSSGPWPYPLWPSYVSWWHQTH